MNSTILHRPDIQFLRGIAVLAVIAGHAFPDSFKNGYLGVDAFFCISGFVIAPLLDALAQNNTLNVKFKFISFIWKRIRRLTPAFLIISLFFCFIFFVLAPVNDFRRTVNQIFFSIPFLGNVGAHLFAGDYFQPNQNPFLHTWSLGVEFQSYIILAGLYLVVKNKLNNYLFAVFFLSLLVFVFSANTTNIFLDYYGLFPRVWEIFSGILIYRFRYKLRKKLNKFITKFIINSSLTFLLLIIFSTHRIDRSLATILIVTLICILLLNEYIYLRSLNFYPLIWIGDRSYSLYLLHLPMFYLIQYSPFFEPYFNNILKILVIFLCFLLSHIIYTLVEQPYRKNNKALVFILICLVFLAPTLVTLRSWQPSNLINYSTNENSLAPWVRNSGCQIFGELLNPLEKPCAVNIDYKNPENLKWLLIGDSHAAMFAQSIERLAVSHGVDLYVFTQYGCPFFTKQIKVNSFGAENCIEHNRRTLNWIIENKPNLVISASRSVGVQQGINFSRKDLQNFELLANEDLISKDVNILRIGTVPETSKYKSNLEKLLPELNIQNNLKKSRESDLVWKSFSKKNKTKYLPSFDILCSGKSTCISQINKLPIYFDENHLNNLGANFIITSNKDLFLTNHKFDE